MYEMKVPSIVIGNPLLSQETAYVDNDNIKAAFEVTQKLINKGHRKIAFMSGSFKFVVCPNRLEGYKKALEKIILTLIRTL